MAIRLGHLIIHPIIGFRFFPPKLETFFKDDANHDPFWSEESLIGAKMTIGGITIDRKRVKQMFSISRLVFELLERGLY